jgi:2-polyprenyl-3-methyl-5-hydroxy-6-metoxy-1,4-benzoquinol methylase
MDAILSRRRSSCPLLVSAYEALLKHMPFLEGSLSGLIGSQDDEFWQDGETRCREILHLCHGNIDRFRSGVSAWVDFSIEYLTRQTAFLRTGRYACTDFDQVRRELYDNADRMQSFYLPALMFSFVFSPNYIGFFRFFRREMLPRIAAARAVCDLGCGHGVYLTQMLLACPEAFGRGLDISPASVLTARALLAYHEVHQDRFLVAQADVRESVPLGSGTQDGLTCFEMIEHLVDPRDVVSEIRRVLRPGAPLCLSTAVRMESVDHLHVFNDPGEVRALLSSSGFTIVSDDCVPLTSTSVADPAHLQRLIADPRVSVGYVALAVCQ